jgi:hypothetical protein
MGEELVSEWTTLEGVLRVALVLEGLCRKSQQGLVRMREGLYGLRMDYF